MIVELSVTRNLPHRLFSDIIWYAISKLSRERVLIAQKRHENAGINNNEVRRKDEEEYPANREDHERKEDDSGYYYGKFHA